MRWTGTLGYALSGSAVLALFAGCSGGGSSSPTPDAQPQSATKSLTSVARQNPQSTSVLLPGIAGLSVPDLSAGFADVNAAAKGAFIVSDSGTNDVDVYTRDGTLIATITGFTQPQGLAAGTTGDVYVANTGAAD